MTKPVLLDTSCIVALLDRSERSHSRAVESVVGIRRPLITCEAVIAEACYLVRDMAGAAEAILENVAKRAFFIGWRLYGNESDVATLMKKYRNVPMDFADACLVAMATEYGTGDILTLDDDFEIYRWGGKRRFRLLLGSE